jgi:hypothetical protein
MQPYGLGSVEELLGGTKVVSFGWRSWLVPTREARVDSGVNFFVDFLEE